MTAVNGSAADGVCHVAVILMTFDISSRTAVESKSIRSLVTAPLDFGPLCSLTKNPFSLIGPILKWMVWFTAVGSNWKRAVRHTISDIWRRSVKDVGTKREGVWQDTDAEGGGRKGFILCGRSLCSRYYIEANVKAVSFRCSYRVLASGRCWLIDLY